jgi:hypothetical protein
MADWPTIAQLQRVLNVDPEYEDPLADVLEGLLESAISRVKLDVGNWNEYEDVPDDSLAQAALRMAQLMALNPETAGTVGSSDPTYQRHMFGHRRTFGVA